MRQEIPGQGALGFFYGVFNMSEQDNLWAAAEGLLAKATALPWGPTRIEALKEAGRLRNEAVKTVIAKGDYRKRPEKNLVTG